MITEKDLQEAIAECHGQRNPNAQTCIKLAAFYTIKNELFGNSDRLQTTEPETEPDRRYSNAAPPVNEPETYIDYDSGSEFSRAIDRLEAYPVWQIIDELMGVLQATNPRLYDGVMREIEQI